MMKFVSLALLLCAASVIAKESDVVVLTDKNFDDVISKNNVVLVEFYAPWCGHCKSLAPAYEQAATELKRHDPPVVLAKVDATEEEELATRFDIQGFPTLKLFKEGVPVEYSGGRTADAIVSWIKKRMGPSSKVLADKAEVEAFKASASVVIIGAFPSDSQHLKTFEKVALLNEDVPFGVVSDSSLVDAAPNTVIAFRNFDEPMVEYSGALEEEALNDWVAVSSLPLVVPFNENTAPKIFGGAVKVQVLFFGSLEGDANAKYLSALNEVAAKHKSQVIFVHIAADEERVLEFFGLTEADLPTLRLVALKENDLEKYKFEGDLASASDINAFVNDFNAGTLKRHLKSEPAPESQTGPVHVLVGTTFKDIVMDSTKDVLVEFYAPWCGHCKRLEPIYDQLAQALKPYDSIVIAKMDATANEVEGVEINGFPTIKFWSAKDKSEGMDFDGDRTVAGFVEFLKEHATSVRLDNLSVPEEHHHDHDHDDHDHDHDHHGHGHDHDEL